MSPLSWEARSTVGRRAVSSRAQPSQSPEDTLLIALARADIQRAHGANESPYDEMSRLMSSRLDWETVMQRARHHGLVALLHRHLRQPALKEFVPADVRLRLRGAVVSLTGRYMWARAELERILTAVNNQGCEPILLRGFSLAETAYEDPALRPFGDIDLLVRESEWSAFWHTLIKEGLEPTGHDEPVLPTRLIPEDMLDHCLSFRNDAGLLVEAKLDPLELGLRMRSLEELWERSSVFRVGSGVARQLDFCDGLLALCVHLNRHGYNRLIWFLDIAHLVRARGGELNWAALAESASAENVRPSVFCGLSLLNTLLGDVVPDEILSRLRPSRLKLAVWRSMWPLKDVLAFRGGHEKGLVFYKSLRSKWLVPNLLLTGRVGKKAGYFLRKAVPPKAFLRERYGDEKPQPFAVLFAKRYATVCRLRRSSVSSPQVTPVSKEDPERLSLDTDGRTFEGGDGVARTFRVGWEEGRQVRASVVIVTYEHPRSELLSSTLSGLRNQSCHNFEVVIVCNGPVVAVTPENLTGYGYPISVVKLTKNRGPGVARNHGADQCVSEIVCFLDDDAIPNSDFVEQHVAAYSCQETVAVRGRVEALNPGNYLNDIAGVHDLGDVARPSLISHEANMSVRKSAFRSVGGFDAELYGHEGLELTYRLLGAGASRQGIMYCPDAVVRHDFAHGMRDLVKMSFRSGRNLRRLADTKPGFLQLVGSYDPARERLSVRRCFSAFKLNGIARRVRNRAASTIGSWVGSAGWHFEQFLSLPWYMTRRDRAALLREVDR